MSTDDFIWVYNWEWKMIEFSPIRMDRIDGIDYECYLD